jgi:filamentous hemagglutinin family protein
MGETMNLPDHGLNSGKLVFFLVLVIVFSVVQSLNAKVVTDGSVGPVQSLPGPNYLIPDSLGTTTGSNLFHSFQIFGINQGQSATFTGPDTITHVISRVTGGEVSTIDGLLRSQVGQAHFFLINPSGLVFGPNAVVDVPAAFHASTADELHFEDGGVFSASSIDSSSLSIAAPISFGFLGGQAGSIEVNGTLLEFKPGSQASLTSGDIGIQGPDAGLYTKGGEIRLTAMGIKAGVVPITEKINTDAGGRLRMESAIIETSGNGGGHLVVQAGKMEMNDAVIAVDNIGDASAPGGVEIFVDGTLSLERGSRIQTHGFGKSNSQGIRIKAVRMQIQGGSNVNSICFGEGDAGSVQVNAGELLIDGQGVKGQFTGIESSAGSGSQGDAGSVDIRVEGSMELINGATVTSSTVATGGAGSVIINAGELKIDGKGVKGQFTGVASNANSGSQGNAGKVEITISGPMELMNGATIASNTFAKGDAGSVTINAGTLKVDGQGATDQFTGVVSGAGSESQGDAGSVNIIISDLLELINGGQIISSTWSKGSAGSVTINASKLRIDGKGVKGQFTGIESIAGTLSEGNAGMVNIRISGLLELINGGTITSSTWSKGDAGSVTIDAGTLIIDGRGGIDQFTGVASGANSGSQGKAGMVNIIVSDRMELINGAQIVSSTLAKGDAGNVTIHAQELKIDGQGVSQFTGIESSANQGSQGNAGKVEIMVSGFLELVNGAAISSSTWAKGNAGDVVIHADSLTIDGQSRFTGIASAASFNSQGNAGKVEIMVSGLMKLINGAQISSSTRSKGDAGSVNVNAGELKIYGQGDVSQVTGIGTTAASGSEGDAGSVQIMVSGLMELMNGAQITSSTNAKGNAGSVGVDARELRIVGTPTGIYSAAGKNAQGYVGDLIINTDALSLENGGKISITADQTLSDASLADMPVNLININTNTLNLDQESRITAESSANVPAGAINIQSQKTIIENSSRITTTSNAADGGPITIQGDSIFLNDGLITTSVLGTKGDGGDITITGINNDNRACPADFLALKGGFIQANTGADHASGGNININVNAVVTDAEGELQVGGNERQTFQPGQKMSVIQAAAPGGEQGVINITAPEVDISSSITTVSTNFADPAQLATNPCLAASGDEASSLIQGGSGGLPREPGSPSTVSYMGNRLDGLLKQGKPNE